MTPSLVAPSERLYRVLNGKCAGMVVPESDTCECERCDGLGEIRGSLGGDGYGDRCAGVMDYEADCPVCGGVGRVLGWPDESHMEVQRLAVVEGGRAQSEESQTAA